MPLQNSRHDKPPSSFSVNGHPLETIQEPRHLTIPNGDSDHRRGRVRDHSPEMPDSLAIIERVRLQAEPMYGWGWSYRNGKNAPVPPPFSLNAVVNEADGFKTALGRLDQPTHPLTSMWIF